MRALGLESEVARWRNLIQSLPLAVCVCDSHWNILHSNSEAERLFGIDPGQIPEKKAIWHFLPGSVHEATETEMRAAARQARAEREDVWKFTGIPSCPVPFEMTVSRLSPAETGDTNDATWQVAIRILPGDRNKAQDSANEEAWRPQQHLSFTWRLEEGDIDDWSLVAQQLYGYTAEEARGQNAAKLLRTQQGSFLQDTLKTGREWSGELVRRKKDGEEVIVEARVRLSADSMTVTEINQDVTPRRRAEQAFNFHFQLTQNITEQAVDPIFVIGGKGEVIFTNPEAERVFGWTREELMGRSLHDTLHRDHINGSLLPSHQCPLFQAQVNGTVVRALELVFLHRDGHPIHVSCSNSPLYFDNQEIGAVLIIRDITRHKKMEHALSQSEERLRVAVAAAQMGTWDLNLVSGEASVDENCRKALNLELGDHNFVTSWLRAVHPEDRGLAKRQIETALDSSGNGQFHLECRTLERSGGRMNARVRYVQAQGQAFFEGDEDNCRAVRLIGTIQDVTGRKRDEDALRRANEDLQQFAYAAAHDLQEPLRNVVNLLGLYKRNLGGQLSGENSELIDASMEDARRMHQMVRDLLSFTNIHQGFETAVRIADANSILKDVQRNLATIISESGASIHSMDLPTVRMMPTHLLQLLQNVISNSIKYRRAGVPLEVQIRARRRGAEWLFSVTDNGIGFDPVYAQKIFGVFKRLHGRSEYPGSGIGLAICARIVHAYSGKIWAEGKLGEGATFYFLLPAAEAGS